MNELPPMVASRTAASRSRRLELASVLQAASRLIHGYAIDAPVDRPHELRKRRPVVRILGRRVADQSDEEGPVAARRAIRDVREQPRPVGDVVDVRLFGKERTRALDALAARLGRAAGPRLRVQEQQLHEQRAASLVLLDRLHDGGGAAEVDGRAGDLFDFAGVDLGSHGYVLWARDGPARRRGARAVDPAREGGGAF